MKPPFKFTWEQVTPADAADMLKKNKNRHLREPTVNAFAADMLNGAWSPSHQGIAFDTSGTLIDGQHRLAAIVRSGISMYFLICRDVPERIDGVKARVMDVLDRGNSRSIADVLKLSHGQNVHPNIIAAICLMIPRVILGRWRAPKLTLSQTLTVLQHYKASIKFVVENRPTTPTLRSAPVSAAVVIAHAVAPRKVEEFYEQFGTGAGLAASSPILAIRNQCINSPGARGGNSFDRVWQAMLVMHAIHAFTKGKVIDRFPRQDSGSEWAQSFIDQQKQTVDAIEKIFPKIGEGAVVTAANWKPNKTVDDLLRSKAMSERAHQKSA